ncbi:MAG: 1-deoxy-D-xylulose-5-phosphate synthase [candidate division KSB1 bacterium]|nr:1-deoxy-D-xylulose-5-phosphate synthase [candidate division KSB1 bacterium]
MGTLLEQINSPADLRKLDIPSLAQVARELRQFMIQNVSQTGGHLAPSLGAVELTLALHYVFDTPRDKIIWDVGHQAYGHKIITGRRDRFHTLRQYKGLSGFVKPEESEYDTFGVGHAGTAISAGLGMACARDLRQEDYKVVVVVGDGALSCGLSFEGLNNAGALGKDLVVILNDNEMSISRNVGALSRYLTDVITAPMYNRLKNDIWELTGKMSHIGRRVRSIVARIDQGLKSIIVPGLLFEKLGFRYIGPVDGHNLSRLIRVLTEVRKFKGPILVHVLTKKGKGYKYAEEDAPRFHGLGPFDIETGKSKKQSLVPTYSELVGDVVVELASRDPRVVGITAAMSLGTGLIKLAEAFPDRFYDVGIAEGHAVTFAAGLAISGLRPIVAIYSTFLQRAYDMIVHDVALQRLPVIFAIDRGGIVGDDGPTHNGVFDLSYLRHIPNLVVMAPKDESELRDMFWTALAHETGPTAIRYPRGSAVGVPRKPKPEILPIGKAEILREGHDVAILAIGSMVYPSLEAAEHLQEQGVSAKVVNARFVKPLDTELLRDLAENFALLVTVEENALAGGFGSAVAEFLADQGYRDVRLLRLGVPDEFIEHGERNLLLHLLGLDAEGIAAAVARELDSIEKGPRFDWRRFLGLGEKERTEHIPAHRGK